MMMIEFLWQEGSATLQKKFVCLLVWDRKVSNYDHRLYMYFVFFSLS